MVLLRTLSEAPQREDLEGKTLEREETGGVTDHRKTVIKSGNPGLMWKPARIYQDHRTWPKVKPILIG